MNIRWGEWAAVNLIHHCEHHLSERVKAAFRSDVLEPEDRARALFRGALQSRDRWDAFEAEVVSRPELRLTNGWLKMNATWMRGQTQGRSRIPPVYSNGAVEQPLLSLRQSLQPRAFAFRNRARLNQLLNLMRLANLRVDNVADYGTDIRAYLDDHPQRTYREIYDAQEDESGAALLNSLWSVPAQVAMREARARLAIAKAARVPPGLLPSRSSPPVVTDS